MKNMNKADERALFRLMADVSRQVIDLRNEVREDLSDLAQEQHELTTRFSQIWLPLEDASTFLGLSERWLLRECERGKLPYYVLGGTKRFKVGDLVHYSLGLPFSSF